MHAALRSVLSEVVFTGHVVLQLYMVQLQVRRTQWVPSRYTCAPVLQRVTLSLYLGAIPVGLALGCYVPSRKLLGSFTAY